MNVWDGVLPGKVYYDLTNIKSHIRRADTHDFEERLTASILELARDREKLHRFRQASLARFQSRFVEKSLTME